MATRRKRNECWTKWFWARINKSGPMCERLGSRCWEWTGCLHPHGHGKLKVEGELMYAHRVAYILHNGDLDDELQVRHKCDNAKCCNPAHLETGTNAQNVRDRSERKRTSNRWIKAAKATNICIPGLAIGGVA